MTKSVHQFVSSFSPRDAVGKIVLSMRQILRDAGYNSNIYAETIHHEMKNEAIYHTKYYEDPDDMIIYHHSFASGLVEYLMPLQNKIVLIYHNITPSKFFIDVDEKTAAGSNLGREQLFHLKNKIKNAFCFSKYSEEELKKIGFEKTSIIDPLVSLKKTEFKKNDTLDKFRDSVNIISVGRIVPHKKIEDVLKVFAYYNQCIEKNSNLFIIGKYYESDPYYNWLQSITETLNLKNVYFCKDVSDDELMSYYNIANFCLILSEHEGFCLPIIEGMQNGIPILAYNAAAIPETLGDSGILLKEKNFEEIAEIMQIITTDQNLRKTILEGQNQRLQRLDSAAATSEFLKHVKNLEN